MHFQTRKLLAFLAEDATDSLLEELRQGPRTERQLTEAVPGARNATNWRLNEFLERELVASESAPRERGKRGQAPRLFRISEPELLRFCDNADEFALALAAARHRNIQNYVDKRRKEA